MPPRPAFQPTTTQTSLNTTDVTSRSSLSPVPPGLQGDLEMELLGLTTALYNLGTTVINDSTKEQDKAGSVKQVGLRINDVIASLANLEDLSQQTSTMIPVQVLQEIDNGKNPMAVTKDRLERAATENQFMYGKIDAISSYTRYLDEALAENFSSLEWLRPKPEDIEQQEEQKPLTFLTAADITAPPVQNNNPEDVVIDIMTDG